MAIFEIMEVLRNFFSVKEPRFIFLDTGWSSELHLFNSDQFVRYLCLIIGWPLMEGHRSRSLECIFAHGNLSQSFVAAARALSFHNYSNDEEANELANMAMDLMPHLNHTQQLL
jgi:hypothetical protein